MIFDSSHLRSQPTIPTQFHWPHHHHQHPRPCSALNEPLVDLHGLLSGDEGSTAQAAVLVAEACTAHGFFQVTNHGVDPGLIRAAHDEMGALFGLPLNRKARAQRRPGELCGYSGAHVDRFESELPWKETFSFEYRFEEDDEYDDHGVVEYFREVFGDEFQHTGRVYQRYCKAMKELSLAIFELLGISLGIERPHFREFFKDGSSVMRCNSYPPCKEPGLTFGTGPHCDPNSLTILHQDQVGGLEVFANGLWQAVLPRKDAFVVNIGDTFMAMCNGKYKSCMHRAVVNEEKERRSLVFFVSPRADKLIRPPPSLLQNNNNNNNKRIFPDFKWSDLLEFTQKHHRADLSTLPLFFQWLPT